MSAKRNKPAAKPVFDSIRKPTAPASRKFGQEKPPEKARPTGRKSKHKKKTEPEYGDADF